jgi:hypothetical protein
MNMKAIVVAALVGMLYALGLAAEDAAAKKETVSIKGEVVDLRCYAGRGQKGTEHAACAAACIKRGVPAALLTENGELIILVSGGGGSADGLAALADGKVGVPVTARGQLTDKHGTKMLVVESIERE